MVLWVLCVLAAPPADVEIEQAGWTTRGTVIHASRENGTYILTCRHKAKGPGGTQVDRAQGERWRAGKLTGTYMKLDRKSDLAYLWTPVYIPGQAVRPLAAALSSKGRCCGSAGSLFTVGLKSDDGHHLVGMSTVLPTGSSGAALLDSEGRVIGVCSGATFGATCFVPQESVVRFLKGE